MKCEILGNIVLTDVGGLYSMTMRSPEIAKTAKPGQILHFDCGEGTSLRRPISICDVENDLVRVCYAVKGKGTDFMSRLKAGEYADVLGPYGNGFPIFENMGRVYLVGGGIGIYPLLFAARKIKALGGKPVAVIGFRTASYVNLTEDFGAVCDDVLVATDDGSYGFDGYVTTLLDKCLTDRMGKVFVCGPKPMMARAAAVTDNYSAECFVSMEERMGCGVGACLACVCRTMFVNNGERGEQYKRVCIDGPVFNAKEIIWE